MNAAQVAIDTKDLYRRLLARWIEASGLTLREIADRCEANGCSVTHSYISKVRSGIAAPPSDKVTRALAAALGKAPDPLILLETFAVHPLIDATLWPLIFAAMDPSQPILEQLEEDWAKGLPQFLTQVLSQSAAKLPTGTSPDERVRLAVQDMVKALKNRRTGQAPASAPAATPIVVSLPLCDEPLGPSMAQLAQTFARESIRVDAAVALDSIYAFRAPEQFAAGLQIWTGDVVLVKPGTDDLVPGNTVLIRYQGRVTARRYYQARGAACFEPRQPGGPAIDPGQVEILGVIRGIIRSLSRR